MREYTLREVEKRLKQCGYDKIRYKGSHAIWRRNGKIMVVPFKLERPIALKIMNTLDKEAV